MDLFSGIGNQRDFFDSKFINAFIFDSSSRMFVVPIKYALNDYFVAKINNDYYCFKIDGKLMKTYRHFGRKSVRILLYDTTHYLPISTSDVKELELMLTKNGLPKLNGTLHSVLKSLGAREKELPMNTAFKEHILNEVIPIIAKKEKDVPELADNLITMFESLGIDKIVTPVKRVADYIEEDLITTDSRYVGSLLTQFQKTDHEHRKTTNAPITAKAPIVKIIAILALVGLCGGGAFVIYQGGYLQNALPSWTPQGTSPTSASISPNQKLSDSQVLAMYPSPEALQAAIQKGDLQESQLSDKMKGMLKQVAKAPPPTSTTQGSH